MLGFVYDNCGETIICTKVKRFDFTHNEGMDGKDDGICGDGQTGNFN